MLSSLELPSRYIRCVKPNPDKERDRLDALEVLRQLQYSGMMETIRIRRQVFRTGRDARTGRDVVRCWRALYAAEERAGAVRGWLHVDEE